MHVRLKLTANDLAMLSAEERSWNIARVSNWHG